jgi:hypothetical protein
MNRREADASPPNGGVRFVVVRPAWWLATFGGMIAFGLIALAPPVNRWYRRTVSDRTPNAVLRAGFAVATLTHVLEARHARRAAAQAGCSERGRRLWYAQTLLVGFPSVQAFRRARPA